METKITRRVREWIAKEQLLAQGMNVIVGYSGGSDSLCLLLLLRDIAADLTDLPLSLLNTHADMDHVGSNPQKRLTINNRKYTLCSEHNLNYGTDGTEMYLYQTTALINIHRRLRHDLDNHLYTVRILIEDGRAEEAARYARELAAAQKSALQGGEAER